MRPTLALLLAIAALAPASARADHIYIYDYDSDRPLAVRVSRFMAMETVVRPPAEIHQVAAAARPLLGAPVVSALATPVADASVLPRQLIAPGVAVAPIGAYIRDTPSQMVVPVAR